MKRFTAALLSGFLLTGCATLVQKSGDIIDGKAFGEKTLSVYRSESMPKTELREIRTGKNDAIVITGEAFPGLRIYAKSSGNELIFTHLEFLSTHAEGWNEFTLELTGRGSFIDNNGKRILTIPEPAKGLIISEGKIRHRDSRIGGTDAVKSLGNRRERILALTEWMKTIPSTFTGDRYQIMTQNEFEKSWKRLLFTNTQNSFSVNLR